MSRPVRQRVTFILLALLVSTPAMAGGDGGFSNVIWHSVNLILLIGLIVWKAKAPIGKALKDRAASVASEIEDARKLHDEAHARLDEYEAKLKDLDAQRQTILDEYRQQGEAEKAKLIDEGVAEAQRLRTEAERSAEHELRQAKRKLETELVERAVDAATKMISEKITAADRQRLTADYLTHLEQGTKG